MTIRPLRGLLVAAPILIAVGIVAACNPPSQPGCPAACPQSYLVPPPNAQLALPPQHPGWPAPISTSPCWNLSVEGGKLLLHTSEGSRSTCEKLTILVNGVDPTEAVVADGRIKLAGGKDVQGGCFIQANARRVSRSGVDGALLTLQGDATLVYVRQGKKVEASAEQISVSLATGQVVSEMGWPGPPEVTPSPIQPVTTPYPSAPPGVAAPTHTNAIPKPL